MVLASRNDLVLRLVRDGWVNIFWYQEKISYLLLLFFLLFVPFFFFLFFSLSFFSPQLFFLLLPPLNSLFTIHMYFYFHSFISFYSHFKRFYYFLLLTFHSCSFLFNFNLFFIVQSSFCTFLYIYREKGE